MNRVYIYSMANRDSIAMLREQYAFKTTRDTLRRVIAESGYDFTKYKDSIVLVKPNWVRHNTKPSDEICLTTHPNFVLAILSLLVHYKPKRIIIGDAPIQGCCWDELLTQNYIKLIIAISEQSGVPIKIVDFRRTVFAKSKNSVVSNLRDMSNYCIVDLAEKSYLEPITTNKSSFRVTDYHPVRLSASHHKGKHLYCIARELFDVDYVIALPKAKTHQKTGITNALKLIVGMNGDKDYLPHHRVGGTGFGGDCYPGRNLLRRVSEYFLDQANRNIGGSLYKPLKFASKMFWRVSLPKDVHHLAAGWHGNDTTWRMVMDLNMIVKYGVADGTLSDKQQRSILYICDGIIAGQGDGPLNPDPLPLGIVMLSDNAAQMDRALAVQMGYDPYMIPLVKESLKLETDDCEFYYNGKLVTIEEIVENSTTHAIPPPGWQPLLEKGDMKHHSQR